MHTSQMYRTKSLSLLPKSRSLAPHVRLYHSLFPGHLSLSGIPGLFNRALHAFRTAVCMIVRNRIHPEDNTASWILTFHGSVNTFFAALFTSQRRCRRHRIGVSHKLIVCLQSHLRLGITALIEANDPGHLLVRNVIERTATPAPCPPDYRAGRYQANNDNSNLNRFHISFSKKIKLTMRYQAHANKLLLIVLLVKCIFNYLPASQTASRP